MKLALSVSGLLGGGDVPLGAPVNTLFSLRPRGVDVGESCVCPTPPSPHPHTSGAGHGGRHVGSSAGQCGCSCGSRVRNRFVLDVFTGCLFVSVDCKYRS